MNPRFPLYIPSKGRADSRLTSKALERIGVPYRIVVEESERDLYASVIDPAKILILDPQYQRDYDACDELGLTKPKGSGPARNFIWDHAVSEGHEWHWIMDDNIRCWYRLHENSYYRMECGTHFRCMEDFCLRYSNIAMAGPQYFMFAPKNEKLPPFVPNTRIYSCNLIRCDAPFRWRGRYNEDTDLSLRMLKAGWCTIQFNAFLQEKIVTQKMRGGNTDTIYTEGTLDKSQMLVRLHPDVTKLVWRYGRWHHHVDYSRFRKGNKLVRAEGLEIPAGANEYGMRRKSR